MSNDEPRPEQPAQPAETAQEAQRNLIAQLAEHAADGTVTGAAAWTAKKVLDKTFGGHGPDKGGDSGPPGDPPPAQTE
jgi:hypothetical protein